MYCGTMALVEIVNNDDFVTLLDKFGRNMRPNKTGPAQLQVLSFTIPHFNFHEFAA